MAGYTCICFNRYRSTFIRCRRRGFRPSRLYRGIKENFTKIFFNILIIIYLTIGPLFAIPRTASTSFEMTITPIAHTNGSLALLIFTIIYF